MNERILHLSGGEQQRVSITRALSYDPQIILADEPTGNLDLATQNDIMGIFKDLAHAEGKCVIIVTHSPEVAAQSDEVLVGSVARALAMALHRCRPVGL